MFSTMSLVLWQLDGFVEIIYKGIYLAMFVLPPAFWYYGDEERFKFKY